MAVQAYVDKHFKPAAEATIAFHEDGTISGAVTIDGLGWPWAVPPLDAAYHISYK
jgi:hypothetical protein